MFIHSGTSSSSHFLAKRWWLVFTIFDYALESLLCPIPRKFLAVSLTSFFCRICVPGILLYLLCFLRRMIESTFYLILISALTYLILSDNLLVPWSLSGAYIFELSRLLFASFCLRDFLNFLALGWNLKKVAWFFSALVSILCFQISITSLFYLSALSKLLPLSIKSLSTKL